MRDRLQTDEMDGSPSEVPSPMQNSKINSALGGTTTRKYAELPDEPYVPGVTKFEPQ